MFDKKYIKYKKNNQNIFKSSYLVLGKDFILLLMKSSLK